MPHNVSVTVRHDYSKGVFYVAGSSVPGLEARASGLDELFRMIDEKVPALIASRAAA